MTIWLVSTGTYSDYGIHSVWSTEELAKEAAGKLYESGYFPMEVDSSLNELKNNRQWHDVNIMANGDVISVTPYDFKYDDPYWPRDRFEISYGKTAFHCTCQANSKEHAIKICNERRIQHLATNT